MLHSTSDGSSVRLLRMHKELVVAVCLDSVSKDYKEIFDTTQVMEVLCAELSALKGMEDAKK